MIHDIAVNSYVQFTVKVVHITTSLKITGFYSLEAIVHNSSQKYVLDIHCQPY